MSRSIARYALDVNPFLRAIDALNKSGARYVIVGGFAAVMHGNDRFTKDLDIVVDLEPSAARSAVASLMAIGMQCRVPIDPLLFADEGQRKRWQAEKGAVVFTMIDPSGAMFSVDLFMEHPLDFEQMYRSAVRLDAEGVIVPVCSFDHLIELKTRAGRPQDLLDIEALRVLRSKQANT